MTCSPPARLEMLSAESPVLHATCRRAYIYWPGPGTESEHAALRRSDTRNFPGQPLSQRPSPVSMTPLS